jgi:hypothetical protein
MADNVGYTPGVGASVAADEISGHLYQRIKPTYGTDGQATDVSLVNPLPVFDDRAENLISLLERLVKISESNQVVDSAQRQRITLDAITAGVSLPGVSTVTTVTTVTTVAAVTNMVSNAGMDREQYINIAKQTYANSIRNRLNIV